jgi:GNAT superfamily N-acetyltransferase
LEIIKFEDKYFMDVYNIVHKTIEEIYPKYYPKKVVEYFHNHHSIENMKCKLPEEYTKIILLNRKVIGTGSCNKNDIGRFFILPEFQNKGYGKKLLVELELEIKQNNYENITLASSLGAVYFYTKCGYKYSNYKIIEVEDDQFLCYLEMKKEIN